MKNPRMLLCLALATPLTFARPAAAQTMPADAATPAVAASNVGRQLDAQTVILRVQPQIGARYQIKQFSRLETQLPKTSRTPGRSAITITKAILDMEVTGRDPFGGNALRLTYRDFSVQSSGTFYQALTTERRRALERDDAEMRAALVGQSFSLKVAPNGELWSSIIPKRVSDAFNNRVASSLLSINTVSLFADRINGRKNEGHANAALPAAPLRLGDAWNYNVQLRTLDNFPFLLSGRRTIKEISNGVASVAESGTVSISSQTPEGLTALTGTLVGTSRVDVASGLPLETNLLARASGKLAGWSDDDSGIYSTSVQDRMIIEPH